VPVFDEEKTVGDVVGVLLTHPLIDEVICVNDGSTDGSLRILKSFKDRIVLIDTGKNKGKGHALASGIKKAKGEIVVFLDADFTNLNKSHISKLLTPILVGSCDGVVGYLTRAGMAIFSFISGQRVYWRSDMLPIVKKMSETRFGVEVFLNEQFRRKKIKKVPLHGLRVLLKHEKYRKKKAFGEYLQEAVEITRVIAEREVISPDKIVARIQRSRDIGELRDVVGRIKNRRIRLMIEKYLLSYIEDARERLKERASR